MNFLSAQYNTLKISDERMVGLWKLTVYKQKIKLRVETIIIADSYLL